MTDETLKHGVGTWTPQQRDELEVELSALIADEKNWLSDLAKFTKNLTHEKGNKLSDKHLHQIKADLQNGGLIDFEGGTRDEKIFGFEIIGNDIKPTVTPHGDAIIPINFWFNSQRRTKLLVLHINDKNGNNEYQLPNGENRYNIEISKEQFKYELIHDDNGFHLKLLK